MERDTLSPELMVYPFMSASVPKQGTLLQNGEKHKVTIHGARRRWKVYIQWGVAWFPQGIVNDTAVCPSAMQPLAQYLPPWLG
jgi:hypothetical protein